MVENIGLLLLTALPLMGSPGPATLSTAAMAAAYGMRASLPFYLGIAAGTSTVVLIVASGISGAILALPGAVPVVTAVAAAYIVYLAWKIATAPPPAERQAGAKGPSVGGGLLLAVTNPKAYAAIGAVYAGTVVVEGDLVVDAAVKAAVLICVVLAVNFLWLAFGAVFAKALANPRLSRAVNIVFAVLLVASVAAALLL